MFFILLVSLFFCLSLSAHRAPIEAVFVQEMIDLKKNNGVVECSNKDYATSRLSILQRNAIDLLLFLFVESFLLLNASHKTTEQVVKRFFQAHNVVVAYSSFINKELPQKKPEDK